MYRNKHHQNRQYNGHCDRTDGPVRKVSFKNNISKHLKKKQLDKILREVLIHSEDDVDMSGFSGRAGGANSNNPNYQRNYNKNIGNWRDRTQNGRRLVTFLNKNSTWFQVTLPYGGKHSKEFLLQTLKDHIKCDIVPLCYTRPITDSSVLFYVDSYNVAKLLRDASMVVTVPENFKLKILVRSGIMPHPKIDDELKSRLAAVMAKRYIAQNKALDLSWFHRDPDLHDVFCPLSNLSIFNAVLDIIRTNIPDIEALDISNNFLVNITSLGDKLTQLKNLHILHMKHNNIWKFFNLEGLSKMNIRELALEGNPLKERYGEKPFFMSEVRKKFPRLVKLDSLELPPLVTFDVNDESKLPEPQGVFMCHPDGLDIVKAFLQQYYALYDSDNRLELAQAYHENSFFSMTAWYPPSQVNCSTTAKLNAYLTENRNLKRVTDNTRRRKQLFSGKLNIVQTLQQLPKTQHDLPTFAVDLTVFTPQLICLTVQGVFRETATSERAIRSFSRTFVIVPMGQGFSIVNDMLCVTNALDEQVASAFKSPSTTTVQSPVGAPAGATSPITSPVQLTEDVKLQMVQMVSARTAMNLDWSKKCLDETNWELERAVWTFNELFKQGSVPAEAFVK